MVAEKFLLKIGVFISQKIGLEAENRVKFISFNTDEFLIKKFLMIVESINGFFHTNNFSLVLKFDSIGKKLNLTLAKHGKWILMETFIMSSHRQNFFLILLRSVLFVISANSLQSSKFS